MSRDGKVRSGRDGKCRGMEKAGRIEETLPGSSFLMGGHAGRIEDTDHPS